MQEEIRAWLGAATHATLATLNADDVLPGFPYGSLVPYALDENDLPLLWLSDLAVHTKNLRVDARCSLLVVDPEAVDPLASWRVTLIGRAIIDDATGKARFFARHPEASALPGFHAWKIHVEGARYIAGFGKMGYVKW
jgi:heme iron utilization protein